MYSISIYLLIYFNQDYNRGFLSSFSAYWIYLEFCAHLFQRLPDIQNDRKPGCS